jgi:hypothetical protein
MTASAEVSNYLMGILQARGISPQINLQDGEYAIDKLEEASSALKASVIADKSLNDSFLESLGFTLDTMLISCYYNNQRCNKSDFTWFRTFEYGNCYTFNGVFDQNKNMVDSKTTSKAGPSNGLVLELFIGAGGKQDFYTMKQGILVLVHERGVHPLIKYEGYYAQGSTVTNIGISKTKYSKKEYPYSDCRKDVSTILPTDSDIFIKTKKLGKYYQKLCYEICLQEKYIIPNCGCSDPSIPITDPIQVVCNNVTSLRCVKEEKDKFDKMKITDTCDSFCPLECNSTTYSATLSSASYPTSYYLKIVKNQSSIINNFNPPNDFSPPPLRNPGKILPLATTTATTRNNVVSTTIRTNTAAPATSSVSTSSSVSTTNNTASTITNIIQTTNYDTTTQTSNYNSANNSTSQGPNSSTNNPDKKKDPPAPPSEDSVRSSILMVSVYLNDLRYTYIEEQESITIDTFIGVIGFTFKIYT